MLRRVGEWFSLNKLDVDPGSRQASSRNVSTRKPFVSVGPGLDQHEPVDLRLQARGHVSRECGPYWRS